MQCKKIAEVFNHTSSSCFCIAVFALLLASPVVGFKGILPKRHPVPFSIAQNVSSADTATPGDGMFALSMLPASQIPKGTDIRLHGLEDALQTQTMPNTFNISCAFSAAYDNIQRRTPHGKCLHPLVVLTGPVTSHIDITSSQTYTVKSLPEGGVVHWRAVNTHMKRLDPGTYDLHVIMYLACVPDCPSKDVRDFMPYAAPGSPFRIVVENVPERSLQPLAPCSLGDSPSDGRWVRSGHPLAPPFTTRSGWAWLPFNCAIQPPHPIWQLPLSAEPLWIMVMGTSTTRGLFWQLMDMVSPTALGAPISKTTLWKCWGVLDYTIGNLRITYRDFRFHYAAKDLKSDGYKGATYVQLAEAWMQRNVCPKQIHSGVCV